MNKKTRLFLMVGGGILAGGVAVGVLASYLGLSAIALGGVTAPADLKYVPADAKLVAYANVHDLMTSELRQAFIQRHGAPKQAGELQANAGIDPERDIDEILVYVSGATPSPSTPREQTAVLARGRFDVGRIEHLMRQHGGQPTDYKGRRVIQHANESNGDVSLAFMEPGLIAFGSSSGVRASIDLAAGGVSILGNDALMGLVRTAVTGDIWAVGQFQAIAHRERMPKEIADRMTAINTFAASGRVNGGLEGAFRVEARDEAAATDLRQVIQGFLALGRLQAGKGTAVEAMLNTIQLGGEQKTVSLEFSVPSSVLATLAAEMPARTPGSAGGPNVAPPK